MVAARDGWGPGTKEGKGTSGETWGSLYGEKKCGCVCGFAVPFSVVLVNATAVVGGGAPVEGVGVVVGIVDPFVSFRLVAVEVDVGST